MSSLRPHVYPRSAIVGLCIVLILVVGLSRHFGFRPSPNLSVDLVDDAFTESSQFEFSASTSTSLGTTIRMLYAPIIHSITDSFETNGSTYEIEGDPIWTEPLNEQLCIVDVDPRPFNSTNEAWGEPGTFNWTSLERSSPRILNHYLYGKFTKH